MELKQAILDLSRQAARGGLSPWFEAALDRQIGAGAFLDAAALERVTGTLVDQLAAYRRQTGAAAAVLGMSGGVDSALTGALLKRAGWRVVGFTLPIEQDPEETERGVEACAALGLEHHHLDLSEAYRAAVAALGGLDPGLPDDDGGAARTRRGNVRARLRMVTLYDQAHRFGGLVASTDNFSELAAGFWTLHGDVGDLAPVQSLLKSWEVPWMARATGVPERTWRAKPTDGLGIGAGDEAQIGASYLEWDLAVLALMDAASREPGMGARALLGTLDLGEDAHAATILETVVRRLAGTWFKRLNPIRLEHPVAERYDLLDTLDARLFLPETLRDDRAVSRFGGDLPDLAHRLTRALAARGERLVTAESCTAGLLAACVAAAPGSSAVLEGSVVAYAASMKQSALGVPEATIAARTVYSAEVARAMALGALDRAPDAAMALAVTGVGGPGPDEGKPAGLVYVAAARRDAEPVVEEFRFRGPPKLVLAAAVREALRMGLALTGEDAGADPG